MSNYLNAITINESFYILPVCNLPINPANPEFSTQEFEFDNDPNNPLAGYNAGTTNNQNFGQYNDNFSEIVIGTNIKTLDIDYISFSSNYGLIVPTAGGQDVNIITCNLVYTIENGLNPFITGDNTSVNLLEQDKYYVQLKAHCGKLIPIDTVNLYSIRDIAFLITESIPAPTASPDKNNKARPYSITLWKKFLTSSSLNKDSFIKTDLLPAGINEYINPYYQP